MTNDYDFGEDWFSMRIGDFEKFLAPLAGSACRLLEIGTYEGRATTWLIDNVMSHPKAWLDTIDPHFHEKLGRNIERSGRGDRVRFHQERSRHVLRQLPLCSYDFIYVDGSHQTIDVMEDAVAAFRLAKVGGIIAFDDYLWDAAPWNQYGVPQPAIDAFLALYARPDRYKPLVEILKTDWQVWVRKLRESAF